MGGNTQMSPSFSFDLFEFVVRNKIIGNSYKSDLIQRCLRSSKELLGVLLFSVKNCRHTFTAFYVNHVHL